MSRSIAMLVVAAVVAMVVAAAFLCPAVASSSTEQPRSSLTITIANETAASGEWCLHYPDEYAGYMLFAYERFEKNIESVEKGMEDLFLQNVEDINITEENETLIIRFDLKADYTDGFVAGTYQSTYELAEYAPTFLSVLTIVLPQNKRLVSVNLGPNELKANELAYYDYNWISPLEIRYTEKILVGATEASIGEEWELPKLPSSADICGGEAALGEIPTNDYSRFAEPCLWVGTGDDTFPGAYYTALQIAEIYKPWLYNQTDECPDKVYYRVVKGNDTHAGFDAYLIQYFAYWDCQDCWPDILFSHVYDYEPIFIWVKNIGEIPYRVAYDHCDILNVHTHEIHRTYFWNVSPIYPDGVYEVPLGTHTNEKAYYPFGNSLYDGDGKGKELILHNLSTSLQHNWAKENVRLGIANCYHTFDTDISGPYCGDYTLSPLNDSELIKAYLADGSDCGDHDCDCGDITNFEAFKYDVSDPFDEVFWEDHYHRDHEFPTISTLIFSAAVSSGELNVSAQVLYNNTEAGGSAVNMLTGLRKDRFTATTGGGESIGHPHSLNESPAGYYTLKFDVSGMSPGTYSVELKVTDNLDYNSAVDYENIVIQNQAPYKPSNPSPSDGATGVSVAADLSWSGGDPDGDSVTYDVYFGTDPIPTALVSDDQTGTTYDPGTLDYNTHYYWKIIAEDEHEATNESEIWDFTNEEKTPKIIYVDDSGGADFTTIQAAVDAASEGDVIFVWNGSYNENVNVNKTLTLQGEGAGVVTVTAVSTRDHVFNVTMDSVNISGFTVTGTTGYSAAGIYLNNANYCIISENNASGNDYGIRLSFSDSNTVTSNIANSNDWYGICLWDSSNNVLTDNTANLSNWDGGIHLEGSSNNTLANNTASLNNDEGIYLSYLSNNNTITNNIADSNGRYGIYLGGSSNNMLTNNNASNNSNGGIYLDGSSNNALENNTCSNGSIYLGCSRNNTLKNNIMSGNTCNFGVWGYDLSDYIQDIGTSNTVNGKPIYYWVDHKSEQVPSDAGFVGVVNSTNITVRDLTLTNNTWAVLFAYTDNSRIENIITSDGYGYGVNLHSSNNNVITNNDGGSIYLWDSNNNMLANNNISIMLGDSNNNRIMNNNASNNWGISLFNSSHNILHNNIANSNVDHGIELSWNSDDNTLFGNTVNSNNNYGISMDSNNNTLSSNIVNSNCIYPDDSWCSGILITGNNNTLTNNMVNLNRWRGIRIWGSSNNTLTNNTVNSNWYGGIYMSYLSNNNTITCNWVQNNTLKGFYLTGGSTGNNISCNNIIENGILNVDGNYHWQFVNNQPDFVEAKHNYWDAGMNTSTIIDASIYDDEEYEDMGRVDFHPFETEPITCADTTPPTLTITSPAPNTTTHSPTITIAGTASDASGIASVTVNGEPANGTGNWSANVTLTEGENTITVIATDREGLTTTAAVTVRYEPLRGDLNRDGVLTPTDAAIAVQIAVGSRPFDTTADVSGDGKVTSLDALMIVQAAAGRIAL